MYTKTLLCLILVPALYAVGLELLPGLPIPSTTVSVVFVVLLFGFTLVGGWYHMKASEQPRPMTLLPSHGALEVLPSVLSAVALRALQIQRGACIASLGLVVGIVLGIIQPSWPLSLVCILLITGCGFALLWFIESDQRKVLALAQQAKVGLRVSSVGLEFSVLAVLSSNQRRMLDMRQVEVCLPWSCIQRIDVLAGRGDFPGAYVIGTSAGPTIRRSFDVLPQGDYVLLRRDLFRPFEGDILKAVKANLTAAAMLTIRDQIASA
jgi:hypothetical protein